MANQLVKNWRKTHPEDSGLSDDELTLKLGDFNAQYGLEGGQFVQSLSPDFAADYRRLVLARQGIHSETKVPNSGATLGTGVDELRQIEQSVGKTFLSIAVSGLVAYLICSGWSRKRPVTNPRSCGLRWSQWMAVTVTLMVIPKCLMETVTFAFAFWGFSIVVYCPIAFVCGWAYWKLFRDRGATSAGSTDHGRAGSPGASIGHPISLEQLAKGAPRPKADIFDDGEFIRLDRSGGQSFYEGGCRYFVSNGTRVFVASSRELIQTPVSASPAGEPQRPALAPSIKSATIEGRLERLNGLHKKGLISQAELEAKRREILNEL